jgi:hypothetical protein
MGSELGESSNFQTNLLGKRCGQGEYEIVGIFHKKLLGQWDWKVLLLNLSNGKIAEKFLANECPEIDR